MKFKVEVRNEVLGNSDHVMTLDEISRFNLVAEQLAHLVLEDGEEHSSGMWTVRPFIAEERYE